MPIRRKYRKARLPQGLIILHDARMPADEAIETDKFDGPYDSADVAYDNDGTTELLSSGWPYKLPVIRQRGDVLELPRDVKLQISPWPSTS